MEEGLRILAPFVHRDPQAHGPKRDILVHNYRQLAQDAGYLPDEFLLSALKDSPL
jgi:hypothetical protein